jgi:hypothetical protein
MGELKTLTAIFILCASSTALCQTQSQVGPHAGANAGLTILSLGEPVVSDTILTWRYRMRNNSAHEVWISSGLYVGSDVFLSDDNQTLFIERRLDRPEPTVARPSAMYVRLRSGETRTERLSLSLPVSPHHVFSEAGDDHSFDHATRLALEIGYYEGHLPAILLGMLAEAERTAPVKPGSLPVYMEGPLGIVGGSLSVTTSAENLQARDEQMVLLWRDPPLKGEKGLRLAVDDVNIPYLEKGRETDLPDLAGCTRMEIEFNPSALEFFFPHAGEQSLLDEGEKQHLQSITTAVIKAPDVLDGLAEELSTGLCGRDACISEGGFADLTCYRDGQYLTSLTLTRTDALRIVTRAGDVFNNIATLRRWARHTPEIKPFDCRVQCAVNLTNLWHRLQMYHIVRYGPKSLKEFWERYRTTGRIIPPEAHEQERTYPKPAAWCDAMLEVYRVEFSGDDLKAGRILRCPCGGKARSSYAMNPNCSFDSPADMVLLFETKPGWIRRHWNQHGGPELFTFDNHNPKGGCVLLNDGTVKFIRTEEELRQLRWK